MAKRSEPSAVAEQIPGQKPAVAVPAEAAGLPVEAAAAPAEQAFTLRGRTDHFYVFFADALGANGQALADAVLAVCESDYAWMQTWFNDHIAGEPEFRVFIQPGRGGARHASCSATSIYVDAPNGSDGVLASYLLATEVAEVFMARQRAGWNCGWSNGEALSRVLANELYPGTADQTATLGLTWNVGWQWLDNGRPDWIQKPPEHDDTNFVSTGCGTLFINWLLYQLGHSVTQVVAAGGPTLESTYEQLTGRTDGYKRFTDLLQKYFPVGTPSGLTTDNPFPLSDPTPPFPVPRLKSATILYQVQQAGTLVWSRYNRYDQGEPDWHGPTIAGRDWQDFTHVFGGGGPVIYAIKPNGQLVWYRHDAANTGDGPDTPGAWAAGSGAVVGEGWQDLATVFSPGGGVIYSINSDGLLLWYRHLGFEEGLGLNTPGAWENGGAPKTVGQGWNEFVRVFGFLADTLPGPTGFPAAIIYGVRPDGDLIWYRHDAAGTGEGLLTPGAWHSGSGQQPVGSGWDGFEHVVATGDGAIFAITLEGTVRFYVHTGYAEGIGASQGGWAAAGDIRFGWYDLRQVFGLEPGLFQPPA
jgi:Tachylectin